MTKKIVKVEDTKNNKIDLNKIKDVIVENKDTIAKIVDIAEDFLDDDKDTKKKYSNSKKMATGKSTKKRNSKASSTSDLSTVIDIAGILLK